jgi:hypothetical protein
MRACADACEEEEEEEEEDRRSLVGTYMVPQQIAFRRDNQHRHALHLTS